MKTILFFFFILSILGFDAAIATAETKKGNDGRKKNIIDGFTNKIVPMELLEVVKEVLPQYPELANVPIEFRITKLKSISMCAQPKADMLYRSAAKRAYVIKVSDNQEECNGMVVMNAPREVLVGLIAHELGHIMDYRERNKLQMAQFGLGYLFSKNYMRKAEYVADSFAVSKGYASHVSAIKNYVINSSIFPETYRNRLKNFYPSPQQILNIQQSCVVK
ncbi:hypothetical protein [Persicobacter psychrovividus]|uniref:Peptidase M48 domain-containing protein n=1 Tax=Persicobacter psychrovividus TaxID=387638 RepID=A0ABN6L833_9BACT|nr:hypothetical protein PEPS_12690 [Persicobacter psychrovividus]